jgi:TatD DNase family protein
LATVWDTHCHLADPAFRADLRDVLSRAAAAGVESAVVVAAEPDGWTAAAALPSSREPRLHLAWGVHPHAAAGATGADWCTLEACLEHGATVAVGEIGLDYHHGTEGAALQRAAFARQLALAAARDLPVILHERDAADDLLSVLGAAGLPRRGGVWHCFSGGPELAAQAVALGLHLGFGGLVTFRKGTEALRAAARAVPLSRLLLETDAPYLSPEPHRGRRNEPARVLEVLAFLAALRGEELEALAAATSANARRLFGGPSR